MKQKNIFLSLFLCLLFLSIVCVGLFILSSSRPVVEVNSKTIKEKFGEGCDLRETCGDMALVDCGITVDGPGYYVDKNLRVMSITVDCNICSGEPKEWVTCMHGSQK